MSEELNKSGKDFEIIARRKMLYGVRVREMDRQKKKCVGVSERI